jgi:hypothetical protein
MIRAILVAGAFALVCLASCNGEDSTGPKPSIMGTWDIVGYSDHGVAGVTTGSGTFRNDRTYALLGTVTYPEEPADSLKMSGSYLVVASTLTLQAADSTGLWNMVFSGNGVILTLRGSSPPTSMTLRKQS